MSWFVYYTFFVADSNVKNKMLKTLVFKIFFPKTLQLQSFLPITLVFDWNAPLYQKFRKTTGFQLWFTQIWSFVPGFVGISRILWSTHQPNFLGKIRGWFIFKLDVEYITIGKWWFLTENYNFLCRISRGKYDSLAYTHLLVAKIQFCLDKRIITNNVFVKCGFLFQQ